MINKKHEELNYRVKQIIYLKFISVGMTVEFG